MRLVFGCSLLTIALASTSGCFAPFAAKETPSPLAPLALPFGFASCQAVIAVVSVPQTAVAPFLPPGFRSVSVQELASASAPNPQNDGNFGAEMFTCKRGDGAAGPIASPVYYGSYWSAVEPPAALKRDVTLHFVKWDVAIADAASRAALAAAGVPARSAKVSFDLSADVQGSPVYSGSIRFNDSYGVRFVGEASAPYPPEGSFVEYTMVPAGLAAWSAKYSWENVAIGPVTVTPIGDSLASKILGAGDSRGVAFAGTVTFHDGNVTVPR